MSAPSPLGSPPRARARRRHASWFRAACALTACVGLVFLLLLLVQVVWSGLPWLGFRFLSSFPSRIPERAGVYSALLGTLWMMGLTVLLSVPVGVGAAIYLEEYAGAGQVQKWIQIAISNLAGVPSIVYGILGLVVFVRWLSLGRSLVAGSLTMTLLILPVIIISSREALRAVPPSLRQASLALGATEWETVRHHVLPAALSGIMTGVILAISRAVGETAPLIMIGALTYVAFAPAGPMDPFTVLPIQIFNWTSRPQPEFHGLAAAGILVLLAVVFALNGAAVYVRQRAHVRRR